jgi:OmpA-OmpF porin, OOP family
MRNLHVPRIVLAALCVAASPLLCAQTRQDVAGGRDHALLSRYQGSWLIAFRDQPFAEVKPLGFLSSSEAAQLKVDKALGVQGEVTELFYVSPAGRTALEVQTNYVTALTKAGAKVLFECTDGNGSCPDRGGPATDLLLNSVVPAKQQVEVKDGAYYAFGARATNLRLSVLQLIRGGVTSYVTVYSVDSPRDSTSFGDSAATYLRIVQPKPMDADKVTVFDARQINAGLAAEGKIALYGIYFDTGKSDLKPESRAQLEQMSKVLAQNAALKVFIVGHTDNQGAIEGNLLLSKNRAEAVIAALVRDFKIDAKRLSARGVANLSPIASNVNEAGRARNRRVEMVTQ